MNKKTDIFENVPVPRALAVMAIPTVISQLITLIYNMADTYFLGLTGNPFMVAVIRQLVFNIPIMLILDTAFGMYGLIWTQFVADIFTVAASYAIYFRFRKKYL